MATTGIAANLLDLGRTFHSRMKAPLTPTEDSTLGISAQSTLADLIRMSKIILVDEATMLDRYMLEALDRTLRDLMVKPEQPFGGKIIILAGDFRQCLPVVPGVGRPEIVKHCINQSHLWKHFKQLRLTRNMRVDARSDPLLEEFDQWTLSIGNGDMDQLTIPESMLSTRIVKNSKKEPCSEGKAMIAFCKDVFPNIEENISNCDWLDGRAILATTNKVKKSFFIGRYAAELSYHIIYYFFHQEVKMINDLICDMVPGTNEVFRSVDELDHYENLQRFTPEYLNSLNPNGFPPHILNLKPGMPLILLRNINPRDGLCNGTKLVFEKALANKVLQCRLAGSDRTVLIPRIVLIPKQNEYPFSWQRRQFPVKAAFSTTINKSQGKI